MKPFDPRLLRVVPTTRLPIAALAVVAALNGLAAIVAAFAISGAVVALVEGRPLQAPLTALVVVFLARGLLAGAGEWLAGAAGAAVSATLRERYAAALLRRPAEARPAPDRALTLATAGPTSVETYVARYLPALVAAGVLPLAAILTMAALDWTTAIIPVLTVPLLPVFAALIGAATAEATERRWRTLARLSGHFLDVMRGLPTLSVYGRADRQRDTIRTVAHEHRRATVETLKLAFVSSAALELLATISVALVAVWVGIRLAGGTLPLEIAMPLILIAPEAYWPIRRVGAEFHSAADGAAALGDLLDVIDEPVGGDAVSPADGASAAASSTVTATAHSTATATATTAHSPVTAAASPTAAAAASPVAASGAPSTPAVTVRDLDYAYPGTDRLVLAGLDAEFPPGLTVLTGASGAGKTTLLELLAGLRRPVSGAVTAPPGARAHLVTQRAFLIAGTVRDNLRLGVPRGRGDDAELHDVLARVGLDGLLATLPAGLDTSIGDDGFGLSAGQRARLAVARALLSDAEVVLLDEPTAHLDPQAEAAVHAAVAALARDRRRIVVAVTHRTGLLELADRRVALAATPVELTATPEVTR